MKPNNYPIIINGLCGTASFVSSSTWAWGVVRASFQVVVASASLCVGTFKLEASNDISYGQPGQPVGNFQPTNWNTIGSSSIVTCSTSAPISLMIPIQEVCYGHLRVNFTATTPGIGSGNFNVRVVTFSL